MIVAVGGLIVIQALSQAGWFAWFDGPLNRAHSLFPVAVGLAVIGGILLLVAWIHGIVLDPDPDMAGSVVLDGRMVSDESIKPGAKVSLKYSGPTVGMANTWVAGFFWGKVLWSQGFTEISSIGELRRAWRSGEWLHVHRLLRATLALVGFFALLTGVCVAISLANDYTALRILLLGSLAFAVVGTARAFARAR